jgi:hypothetical protein
VMILPFSHDSAIQWSPFWKCFRRLPCSMSYAPS